MRKVLAVILSLAVLAGCGYGTKKEVVDPKKARERAQGSILGDNALIFGGEDKEEDTGSGVAVNSFLWRASLDTLSFMPLSQVDPFGGVIISDWYSPPESPGERFKLTVYVLTRQLRSDGIRVAVFKQARQFSGEWQNVDIDDKTATQMENAILTRARQMRINLEQSPE